MANVLQHQPMYYPEPQFSPPDVYGKMRWSQQAHYMPWDHLPMQEMGAPIGHWQMPVMPRKVAQPRKSHPQSELSRTNIYISGLKSDTTDEDLKALCQCFGEIVSTKAIIDRELNICKGYGFVMFDQESSARAAIDTLVRSGAQATFAKMTRAQLEYQRSEVDPTNLYFTNLPKDFDESQLTTLLMHAVEMSGEVVSCRVLRDEHGVSRGVALARMGSREACEAIISRLNGCTLPGCLEPMRVKYANGPTPRRSKSSSTRTSASATLDLYGNAQHLAHDMSAHIFDDHFDEPTVPSVPGTPNQARHPGSLLASPNAAPGSRLSNWVQSPREDSSLHVPAVPQGRLPSGSQDPYELEFAFEGNSSYDSVQRIFEDFE